MNKINFQNLPSTATPIDADNLNLLQSNVENALPVLDTAVSTSSTNGIENQAITNYVDTKGINDSGSNANGNYIKYDDGTLICYGLKYCRMGAWEVDGSVYTAFNLSTSKITFPIEFYSKPTCYVNIAYESTGYWETWFGRITWNVSGVNDIQLFRANTASTNLDFQFSYIAIGRWKA